MAVTVHGDVAAGFGRVADAFRENFTARGEVGAAVTVVRDHEVVVELWGGTVDEARDVPWRANTLVNYYSAGKSVAAATLLQLVDAGTVGLDDLVARWWPEFAAHDKGNCTVRHALSHRAGVPAIRSTLRNEDLWRFDVVCAALAATAPWYPPGERLVYHTNTFGHLIGELVRRASGLDPHAAVAALAARCGAELHVGLHDDDLARCATVHLDVAHSPATRPDPAASEEARMVHLGYFNPPGYSSFGVVNSPEWRRAMVPSTNGHGTATGLARFYDALLTPGRVLSRALLDEATSVQAHGHCPVLGEEVSFGLGFQPTSHRRRFTDSPRSFGHFGTGGAVGCGDPDEGLAIGYVMNHVVPRWQSTRNRALLDAVTDR